MVSNLLATYLIEHKTHPFSACKYVKYESWYQPLTGKLLIFSQVFWQSTELMQIFNTHILKSAHDVSSSSRPEREHLFWKDQCIPSWPDNYMICPGDKARYGWKGRRSTQHTLLLIWNGIGPVAPIRDGDHDGGNYISRAQYLCLSTAHRFQLPLGRSDQWRSNPPDEPGWRHLPVFQ